MHFINFFFFFSELVITLGERERERAVTSKILKSEKNHRLSVGIKLFRVDHETSMGLVALTLSRVHFSLREVRGFDRPGYLFYFPADQFSRAG